MNEIGERQCYISELEQEFGYGIFERVNKTNGVYVTNERNRSASNDLRIFRETQLKRILRSMPFVPKIVKRKLSYFSRDESNTAIYQLDNVQELTFSDQGYAFQNVGHATQLIQIPGFNILTDPVFNSLSNLFYPEKTKSFPNIGKLPRIDVIIISHNHRDHVDRRSLRNIQKQHQKNDWPHPKLLVPLGDKKLFETFGFVDIEEVDWYTKIKITKEDTKLHKSVHFISIPADHRSGRSLFDNHQSLVTGWIINPEHENVIFKYSGDTRQLSDRHQRATDLVLWHEIKRKQIDQNAQIPQIICFEPSGPNYTRHDMNITHQSTSYSALLKFCQAHNLARASGKSETEFLDKIKTIVMHHNKFELGPDRFNEGLFVFKKLLNYLLLSETELDEEQVKQQNKLDHGADRRKLAKSLAFVSRGFIAILPKRTSLLVHAKNFIIEEIKQVRATLEESNRMSKEQIRRYLIDGTIFPKIGERFDRIKIQNSRFDVNIVNKYVTLNSQ